MRTLVWFRGNDLRLRDHVALASALGEGEVVLVHVVDPNLVIRFREESAIHRLRFYLQTVDSLERSIEERGSRLLLFVGDPCSVIPWLVEGCRAAQIVALHQTDPVGQATVNELMRKLRVPLRLFDGETLVPIGSIRNQQGEPYSVFGAFARSVRECLDVQRIIPPPKRLPPLPPDVEQWLRRSKEQQTGARRPYRRVSDILAHRPRSLRGVLGDAFELRQHDALIPTGGEAEARARWNSFVKTKAQTYVQSRDRADVDGTSRLSADLKFGSLSVRQVWTGAAQGIVDAEACGRFQTQLIWREFAHATLRDRPELLEQPFQRKFAGFPWRLDAPGFARWSEGRTGYPIVDAAARQLRQEGFVHNRARMIAASFLAKNMLIDFRWGERHYLDWLIDGDPAQNDLGWQWSSGSGCDAQPYFRIFNPIAQAKKVDPEGTYVRRYLPELSRLSARYVHAPWLAPPAELAKAGVRLGREYPAPCLDHAGTRNRFLAIAAEHFAKGVAR